MKVGGLSPDTTHRLGTSPRATSVRPLGRCRPAGPGGPAGRWRCAMRYFVAAAVGVLLLIWVLAVTMVGSPLWVTAEPVPPLLTAPLAPTPTVTSLPRVAYLPYLPKDPTPAPTLTPTPTPTPTPTNTPAPTPTKTPTPTGLSKAECRAAWRSALDYARIYPTFYPSPCRIPCEYVLEYTQLIGIDPIWAGLGPCW